MSAPVLQPSRNQTVIWGNKKYLFFGGYDYHRLSQENSVVRAAVKTMRKYGVNCGGSRITTGNHPLHILLEEKISSFMGMENSILLPTGYMANFALMEIFSDKRKLCFCDEKMHPSLKQAVCLSGCRPIYFKSRNVNDLKHKLKDSKNFILITDGVCGGLPPVTEYFNLCEKHKGFLVLDEAHCIGVLGDTGRGSCERAGIMSEQIILTGSLSKAPGTGGGFISGPLKLTEKIRKTIAYGTTSAPPLPVVAASIASLDYLEKHPEDVKKLQNISLSVKKILKKAGYDIIVDEFPAVGIYIEDKVKSDYLYQACLGANIYPPFISYPERGDYFRFTFSSRHTAKQIHKLLKVLTDSADKILK